SPMRTSAPASRCRSTRTSPLELSQNLGPRRFPVHRLRASGGDVAGTSLQLVRPSDGELVVRLLQAREQLLGDARTMVAREAQRFGEQLLGGHGGSVAPSSRGLFSRSTVT